METCVLIPQQFSLAFSNASNGNDIPPPLTVWTSSTIQKGHLFYPFQGTLRIGQIQAYNHIEDDDIRYHYGLYDEIALVLGKPVRHCNWIRFLRISERYTANVNMVCTRLKGKPVYEAIKSITSHQELVVFYITQPDQEENNDDDDGDGDLLPEIWPLSSQQRPNTETILEDTPLDLSMSLLHHEILPVSPISNSEDEQKSNSMSSSESSGLGSELLGHTNEAEGEADVEVEVEAAEVTDLATRVPKSSKRLGRGERCLLSCSVCDKMFDRPSLLKRHMRTHTGEKPHVCAVCGKGFSTSSSLNTHRRIHSGEKPHECQVCGKKFTASSNLYYHRMTHVKEKPHKCNLCSKSFPTPGDLKSHMYVHSGSWPFKCHICFRGFSKQTNLKNHLFLHTGDKPHVCELCNKKFALACNLRAHIKTHASGGQGDVSCAEGESN